MASVKALRRLSQEGSARGPEDDEEEVNKDSDAVPSSSAAIVSDVAYTIDGGRVLGRGWAEYWDPESQHAFFVNEVTEETIWKYPEELLSADGEEVYIEGVGAIESYGGGGFPPPPDVESGVKSPGVLAQINAEMALHQDEDTDCSSDGEDVEERAARLGGGFRGPRPKALEEAESAPEEKRELKGASAAMLAKLNATRAGQAGDLMENQAAFKSDGMLMLESIANKDDPTGEKEDDAEAIARLQGERVKMQEVRPPSWD